MSIPNEINKFLDSLETEINLINAMASQSRLRTFNPIYGSAMIGHHNYLKSDWRNDNSGNHTHVTSDMITYHWEFTDKLKKYIVKNNYADITSLYIYYYDDDGFVIYAEARYIYKDGDKTIEKTEKLATFIYSGDGKLLNFEGKTSDIYEDYKYDLKGNLIYTINSNGLERTIENGIDSFHRDDKAIGFPKHDTWLIYSESTCTHAIEDNVDLAEDIYNEDFEYDESGRKVAWCNSLGDWARWTYNQDNKILSQACSSNDKDLITRLFT